MYKCQQKNHLVGVRKLRSQKKMKNILTISEAQSKRLELLFEATKKKPKAKKRRGREVYPFPLPWMVAKPGDASGSDYIAGADSYMV